MRHRNPYIFISEHQHQFQYTGNKFPIYEWKLPQVGGEDRKTFNTIPALEEMRCNGCGKLLYKTNQGVIVEPEVDFVFNSGGWVTIFDYS